MRSIIFSGYMKFRIESRGFDLQMIEELLKFSAERYLDAETNRIIAIGDHGKILVCIPYEKMDEVIHPVTVHATTRQQINFRIKTGRYVL